MTFSPPTTAFLLAQQAAEGLETQVVPSWPAPLWLTVLLVLAAVVFVVVVYVLERDSANLLVKLFLAGIRATLVLLVVFMLLGWMRERFRTDLPDVVLIVDDTASMSLEDHFDDEALRGALLKRASDAGFDSATRINLAKALLLADDGDLLEQLRSRYNIKFYFLGESARAQADRDDELQAAIRRQPAEQQQSRLGKGVRDVIEGQRGRPTAAVILLTDGVTTEGRSLAEAADYARLKSIPLFTIGVGNEKSPRDVRVSDLLVDDVVFVGDIVNFDFKVTGSGYEGKRMIARLRQKGSDAPLAEQPIVVGRDGQPQSARITYQPTEKGEFEYVVEIEPLDAEADAANNRESHTVSVRDETIRVLMVYGYPNYEYKLLKPLLERQVNRDTGEKSIELSIVLQEAGEGFAEIDASARTGFPVGRDELFGFDVIIFGDVDPSEFTVTMMDNISAFVKERGGGIVFSSGPRYTPLAYRNTPLAELMPIDLNTAAIPTPGEPIKRSFQVRPTRLGMISPQLQLGDTPAETAAIWQRLPGMYWLLEAPDLKPGARVLAEHPTRTGSDGINLPVIVQYYVGAGKVIYQCTDETFQWRFRIGDAYFGRYWIQTLRDLSRAKLLGQNRSAELTVDRDQYRQGDTVRLRARFLDDRLAPPQDDGVSVVLEREGGRRQQLPLVRDTASRGVFEGTAANLPEGTYRAWMASPTLPGNPPAHRFSIVAPPGEFARMEMDAAELKRAAEISRGKYYRIEDADRLPADLPRGRQVRIQSLPPTHVWSLPMLPPLFDAWLLPAAFVVLLVAEWLLRKRVGLL